MNRHRKFVFKDRPLQLQGKLFVFVLLLWAAAAQAEKTDIVVLINGNHITCEIENLERGRLKVKTDSLGTINIEWKDILRVTSKEFYIVEMFDGNRIEGILAQSDTDRQLIVFAAGEEKSIDMANVVWIDPLKSGAKRIARWDGSISAGFDLTKTDRDTSLNASFSAERRAETYLLSFDGSVNSRSQDSSKDTLRASFNSLYRGFLQNRWYWAALGGLESNDELGLDLRTTAGGGFGRFLVQNNNTLWSFTTGLAVVNEKFADEAGSENNIAALFNTDYAFFTYDSPKTTIDTSLSILPILTDWGRWRSNVDLSLRRELVTDLFVELSFYGTYDNEPPDDAEKEDYGIVTSLGYTF